MTSIQLLSERLIARVGFPLVGLIAVAALRAVVDLGPVGDIAAWLVVLALAVLILRNVAVAAGAFVRRYGASTLQALRTGGISLLTDDAPRLTVADRPDPTSPREILRSGGFSLLRADSQDRSKDRRA